MEIIKNTQDSQHAPASPRKLDGNFYTYELICGDNRAYSDTPGDLIAYLIPGYLDTDSPLVRMESRIRHALGAACRLQAVINDLHSQTPRSPYEHQILFAMGTRHVDVWDCLVPLVLVDSLYAPVTQLDRPLQGAGVVFWLEPEDEFNYLVSLQLLGLVSVNMCTDKAI